MMHYQWKVITRCNYLLDVFFLPYHTDVSGLEWRSQSCYIAARPSARSAHSTLNIRARKM